jgi:SAM-dependent methyltransferase
LDRPWEFGAIDGMPEWRGMEMGIGNTREPKRDRTSFNRVASLYDQYRRGYPLEVVDQIVDAAGIRPGDHLLEIGPGTGQLTRPLLERGMRVTAVELGPDLAAIARRKLGGFPDVHIHVAAFEDWGLPSEPFKAVVSATAFHWLDPRVRATKAAHALEPGGRLVAVYPHHILGDDGGFFLASQPCYLKWGLSTDPHWRPPLEYEIPTLYQDIDQCAAFLTVERRRLRMTRHFNTDDYVGLLRTDSLILTLPEPDREGFLEDLHRLIETEYDGMVSRTFVYEIVAAEKE